MRKIENLAFTLFARFYCRLTDIIYRQIYNIAITYVRC